MKRIKFRYIILGMLVTSTACTKGFLDINKDPNNPAKVSLSQLLPATEMGLASSLGFTNDNSGARGLTEVLAVYTHQVTVREDPDKYGATGSDFSIDNSWVNFWAGAPAQETSDVFGTMQNLEVMIKQATDGRNMRYAGIGKILKAYGVSQFIDAYGDVPYTEATKFGETGNRYPKFDKGSEVYPKLLALLDEAIVDLGVKLEPTTLYPDKDDIMYGGNKDSWIKVANTIKLKLYNQLRLIQDVSGPVNALLANPGKLISATDEGFMLKYGTVPSPDNRNPGFNEYVATQKSHYQSPWFYEILKGYNGQIFTGIEDPRVPYYFFRQAGAETEPQNGTEYRDGGFISIYFASSGPNRDKTNDKVISVFGIYPVGGRYDDGNPTAVSSKNATGAAPLRLLTYADRLFIEAELMNAKVIAGDPRAKLSAAIDESMKQVDFVVGMARGAQSVPVLGGTARATAYRDAVLAEYDKATTDTRRLEYIMTEKWIQSFGFSCDQYTDYRRTGYPVLFDPNNAVQAPGGFVQPPINGDFKNPGAQPKVKVSNGRKYPLSLPWPASEANVNPNTPPAKNPDAAPVFWDKN
ncbi:SusD/RagB family nutrient-binding outer membrane lipoprotein [Chitinophaga flava]|uniref:SusD/RagB family nutrient-binding outer membrane lipoprotein n=1 Tax=Chitinophaga flava TaxID=2259036 RepID=A0A365Y3V9_9BACT|nr:SusD/RagB family nutrient-binding outer membrane lipoprotein [Chitinophaga flava]RBL93190.1 SusD/RagB family nutrient-binding outer membrane lipoprotein [Chitinophaga flava]